MYKIIIDKYIFCSKIGEEQSSEDAEDGPPELLVCGALFVVVVTQLFVTWIQGLYSYIFGGYILLEE